MLLQNQEHNFALPILSQMDEIHCHKCDFEFGPWDQGYVKTFMSLKALDNYAINTEDKS